MIRLAQAPAISSAAYDRLGIGYARMRRPDPRIARAIAVALGGARSAVNVGAGAGSYEPALPRVVAVEPSTTMIRQRPPGAAPAVRAVAEALPFADGAFDAALAILTVHHWNELERGLREMRRVARRVVVLTHVLVDFWLLDYLPELRPRVREVLPVLAAFEAALGAVEMTAIPVPHDCSDGFLGAYWRRPAAYLDPEARAAISIFHRLGEVSPALARLERDLRSGEWQRRYGQLLGRTELDLGYRLIVAGSALTP
jgi:SAM-dependent methyltransferase